MRMKIVIPTEGWPYLDRIHVAQLIGQRHPDVIMMSNVDDKALVIVEGIS